MSKKKTPKASRKTVKSVAAQTAPATAAQPQTANGASSAPAETVKTDLVGTTRIRKEDGKVIQVIRPNMRPLVKVDFNNEAQAGSVTVTFETGAY